MRDGGVSEFAGVAQRELVGVGIGLGDRKANGIPIATCGEMRTGGGVSEVAEFPYVGFGGG